MGCSLNKCSPDSYDKSLNIPVKRTVNLLELSDAILRYILCFLPQGRIKVNRNQGICYENSSCQKSFRKLNLKSHFHSFDLEQIFWNVGFVCRRLLLVSLKATTQIELNWYKLNESKDDNHFSAQRIKEEIKKLLKIYNTKEVTSCIKVSIYVNQRDLDNVIELSINILKSKLFSTL